MMGPGPEDLILRIFFLRGVGPLHVPGIDILRKVAAAPEAPARPEAASSAVLRPKLRPKAAAEGRSTAAT
jgi:hypothetical protein